jgi:RHS repeat-associated protein
VTNRLNQLTQTNYLTDNLTEYTYYDPYGNLVYIVNSSDPVFGYYYFYFYYDTKNRLIQRYDSRGKSLLFTYDRTDNILTKTDYQGDVTQFKYDSANHRTAMRNAAYLEASYQHDGAGRVLSRILSDGAQTQYAYNKDGQLTGIKSVAANGDTLDNVTYTRDHAGNILTQSGQTSGNATYVYDPLYRLSSATYSGTGGSESYTFDAVGNRITQTLNGVAHAYEYYPTSNRLKAVHAGTVAGAVEKSFVYDDEGRLTGQAGTQAKTLLWDQKNRAKTINAVSYVYDPSNYRIGQRNGVLGNRDYYLEGEHLEAEYSGANIQAKYFRGLSTDELVAGYGWVNGKWTPEVFHHDALMSVTGITAADGTTLNTASYSAFGDRTVASMGSSANRLTYTGREKDQDTGLYYYRARYYDSSIGRFISEDPLGFQGSGVNWYAYTGNNPINANDPTGLEAFVYAAPRAQGGFNYRAFDDNGSKMLTGTFNANTWVNTQQLPAGSYTVSPRPYLDTNYLQQAKDLIFGDRNAHAGRPTISNTDNWNTTVFPDGSSHQGIEIHPGRTADGGGVSLGCLVCSDADYGQLNSLFQNNYNDGGVNLRVLSGSMQDAFPSLKITPNVPSYQGTGGGSAAPLTLDTNFGSMSDIGGAAGGFLLYPYKPNNNQMQSVYSK